MGKARNDEINAMIAKSGIQVIKLRESTANDQRKADRKFNLLSKSMEGDEMSKEILERETSKERRMIFSRTDRWRMD